MGPVIVEFTVRLGYAIFTLATLSFLGFGIQPPSPDWGLQIYEHYGLISGGYWWPVVFPALAIASLVVGVNLVADGLSRRSSDDARPRSPSRARDRPRSSSRPRGRLPRARDLAPACCAASASRSPQGESYGLVGESGCGKSTAAFAALRYLPRNGRVRRRLDHARRRGPARDDRRAECASCGSRHGLDGLPEPRRAR